MANKYSVIYYYLDKYNNNSFGRQTVTISGKITSTLIYEIEERLKKEKNIKDALVVNLIKLRRIISE